MDLKGTQLQQTFGNLVTVGTSAGTPTLGQIENGNGDPLTQVTLALGSASAPSYSFTGDTDTGMFSSGADALNLATGGNNRMTIASGGNISIGTANSSAKLQVGTSSEEILRLERDTITNDSFIDLTYASGHSNDSDANHEYSKIRTKVVANLSGSEASELHFQTINAGTMGTPIVIDQAGLVGIGSTSGGVPNPAYALEVKANSTSGVLAVQNAANDRNTFRSSNSGGTRTLDIGNNSSGHGILNIRNSSGTVNTQLLGSGSSYFNGGNIGIGTSSPDANVQIMNNDSSSYRFGFGGTSDVYLDADNVFIRTDNGGANTATFTTTGLGVGTNSPSGGLHVKGDTNSNGAELFLQINNNNTTDNIGAIHFGNNADSTLSQILSGTSGDNTSSYLTFSTSATGTLAEAMRIDKDGNVGIGTTSPAAKLQVEGDLDVRTATNKNIHIKSFPSFDNFSNEGVGIGFTRTSSDADLMAVGVVDTDKLGMFSRSGLILATGGSNAFQNTTERMRIDSVGNLLIGTTTTPSSSVGNIVLKNGTAPTGNATDGIILYAEDVSSSSELKVRDEAGNVTTLSPHNFSLIPEGASEPMAWSYYSERNGKKINVDMLKLARMVESLTGEKLIYEQ